MTRKLWIGGGLLVVLGAGLAGLPATREAMLELVSSTHPALARSSATSPDAGDEPAGGSGNSGSHDAEASARSRLSVAGVELALGPFVLSVRASGRAEAPRRVELSARVAGQVDDVAVTEGDRVSEGDLLVALDDRPYRLTLAEATARRSNAEVDTRVRLLGADTSAASTRRELSAHRSGLTEAEQAVRRAELDLEAARVTAPFDASVSDVAVTRGANVQSGSPLVTLVDLATIRVPAEVLERDFGRIRPGAPATVRFVAYPGEIFDGEVRSLSPECDPETGTGIAYIDISNPDGRIRPGMYAEVVIEADRLADRLSVPRAAVLERERRLLVFKAANGRAEWQYVDVGLGNEHEVEITSGLAPGDTVLVDGHLTLAHGAPIRVRLEKR